MRRHRNDHACRRDSELDILGSRRMSARTFFSVVSFSKSVSKQWHLWYVRILTDPFRTEHHQLSIDVRLIFACARHFSVTKKQFIFIRDRDLHRSSNFKIYVESSSSRIFSLTRQPLNTHDHLRAFDERLNTSNMTKHIWTIGQKTHSVPKIIERLVLSSLTNLNEDFRFANVSLHYCHTSISKMQ